MNISRIEEYMGDLAALSEQLQATNRRRSQGRSFLAMADKMEDTEQALQAAKAIEDLTAEATACEQILLQKSRTRDLEHFREHVTDVQVKYEAFQKLFEHLRRLKAQFELLVVGNELTPEGRAGLEEEIAKTQARVDNQYALLDGMLPSGVTLLSAQGGMSL